MTHNLTFLIVDDQERVRTGIRSLLQSHTGWSVCGEAANGGEAVQKARSLHPGVVVMDVAAPSLNGLEAARRIHEEQPAATLVLVGQNSSVLADQAREVHARGYVRKSEMAERLVSVIEQAQAQEEGPIAESPSPAERASGGTREKASDDPRIREKQRFSAAIESADPRTELALRESEERFRTLADNISQLAWMANETGWVFWYNRRWFEYTGTTLEEMKGWGWTKVHHPDHLPRVLERLRRSWETGEAWEDVFPLLGKDGNYRWFLSHALPIRNNEGRVGGWLGTCTDITEQRKTEEALRESEERLRAFVTASSTVVYRVSPDWKEVRQLYGRGLNYETTTSTRKWLDEWVHPEDRNRVLRAVEHAIRAKQMFEVEYRFPREDGSWDWAVSRVVPMLDARGEVVEWFGAANDISLRKRAEEALQHSEWRARQLIDSNIIPVAFANLNGVTEANDAFLRLIGGSRKDLQSGLIDWKKSTPPEHLPKDLDAIEQLNAHGFCAPYEKEYIRHDGTRVPVLIAGTALNREPLEWVCFLLDLSEIKRTQAELQAARAELELRVDERTHELAEALRELQNEVAVRRRTEENLRELSTRLLRLQDMERRHIARELHDSTGQTLAALKMCLSQIERRSATSQHDPKLFEDAKALAEQAIVEIRSMSHLLHPPLLDEVGFASAAQWYVREFEKRSNIKVSCEVAPVELPKDLELVLFRVLQESLTNVLRHSAAQSAEVSLAHEQDSVALSIRDSGKGIPPQRLAELRDMSAAHGVGLTGMRERLRDVGGTLEIASDSSGTVVTATIHHVIEQANRAEA